MKTITRLELYTLSWEKPVTQLAKDLKLIDLRLRKICRDNSIPLPNSAYWTKIRFGKPVEKIALPDNTHNNLIELDKQEWNEEDGIRASISGNKELNFKVKSQLTEPDPIVKDFLKRIDSKKKEKYYSKDSLVNIGGNAKVSVVSVMPKNLDRLFLIVDCLIKNFRTLGYNFIEDYNGFALLCNEEKLYLCFREKSNYVPEEDRQYSYQSLVPNGKLSIKLKNIYDKEFSDTDSIFLEDQIERILIYIAIKFNTLRIEHERSKERSRLYEIEKKKEEEIKQRKDDELIKFKLLIDESERWKKFEILVEYYNHLKEVSSTEDKEVQERLKWIKSKLDWYNPAINAFDELLDNVNRNTLEINKPKSWW